MMTTVSAQQLLSQEFVSGGGEWGGVIGRSERKQAMEVKMKAASDGQTA